MTTDTVTNLELPAMRLGPLDDKSIPVSWDQFHNDARHLAHLLKEHGPFSSVVAVTRGGLFPTGVIATELNLRLIDTICIASYEENHNQGNLSILKWLGVETYQAFSKTRQPILVVDDLIDTGNTAHVISKRLQEENIPFVYVVLYDKLQGQQWYYRVRTSPRGTWILFPWNSGLTLKAPISDGRK